MLKMMLIATVALTTTDLEPVAETVTETETAAPVPIVMVTA
jgi:hypothetical protein